MLLYGMILILLTVFLLFCLMMIRGYVMYFRSGGKNRIREKIAALESCGTYVKVDDICPTILFVTLALEDKTFFAHKGINLKVIYYAARENIRQKRIVCGGSTITQQLAKNLLFGFQRTYTRKFAELFAVAMLEKNYSKEKILEVYLNCIEYGNENWGIKSACDYYASTSPATIDLAQAISLIAMLPAPKRFNPTANRDAFYKARSRAVSILKNKEYIRIAEGNIITESQPFEKGLFNCNIERFYREIFKNSLRMAAETKTVLKANINSVAGNKILDEKLCSEELVSYAQYCHQSIKTCYMWGGIMDSIEADLLKSLSEQYKEYYTAERVSHYKALIDKDIYGCDCSGLIKSYIFGGIKRPDYEELYDLNSRMMLDVSGRKGKIAILPEIKGICLYMPGHVGIYMGGGQVMECTDNERLGNGVIETNIKDRDWTDWFYCPFVSYQEEDAQV